MYLQGSNVSVLREDINTSPAIDMRPATANVLSCVEINYDRNQVKKIGSSGSTGSPIIPSEI